MLLINMENCTFSTVGRNRFFSLEPGHQLVLQSSEEKAVITVLNRTKMIGGVRTRVIEEKILKELGQEEHAAAVGRLAGQMGDREQR